MLGVLAGLAVPGLAQTHQMHAHISPRSAVHAQAAAGRVLRQSIVFYVSKAMETALGLSPPHIDTDRGIL